MKKSIAKVKKLQEVQRISKSQQLKTKGLSEGLDTIDSIIIIEDHLL